MSDRIERRLEIEEDREDLRVKIFYDRQALIVYFYNNPTLDVFYARIREACKLTANQPVTVKWIDTEEDPCTISSQLELVEAIRLTTELREAELKVHVFLGLPLNPGAPCPGEDKNVYRRGARRWKKKIYHVNGHRFQPKRLNQRTECALCTDTIWGLGRAGFRCADCGMCVHKKCHKFVSAKCSTWTSRMPENCHSSPQLQNGAGSTAPSTQASRSLFVAGSPSTGPMQENKIESHQPQRLRRNWGSVAPAPPVTAANGHSDKPGLGIDDFELLTVIGRGSYAKVVQAEHKSTGQIYAIKIIKKSLCTDEEDIDWIQTEKSVFETASNHPFLVGLHSCFQTPSRLFFVIEFIPGGDLMFHMQHKQRLPEDHARFYSAEIILALHFLHSRSIIYRDLKLDNVLIDAEGHIKLTDFGMCKEHIGALDLTNTFCGTPNYIAPEILRGEDYGFSVDYWALGVLMFEMMAGRSPFHLPAHEDDQNTEDFLFQIILERQIRIPRHLTVRAANVLKGFLNKDPADRLGCKPDIEEGLNDIKSNNFFKSSIDWELLEQRQIQPPYNPNLAGERDLQRFDTTFTTEEPRLTPDDPTELDKIDQSEFEGFEYINPLIMSREDNV